MLDISLLMEELTIKWIQKISTYAQLSQHNFYFNGNRMLSRKIF